MWFPSSTIPFSFNTSILSAFCIVVNLWAIVRVVLPFASLSNDFDTKYSLSLSNADVASSSINIFGFFKNTLAILILCFCPPDNFTPLSPTYVSYPSFNSEINSWAPASFAASIISSFVAFGFP